MNKCGIVVGLLAMNNKGDWQGDTRVGACHSAQFPPASISLLITSRQIFMTDSMFTLI